MTQQKITDADDVLPRLRAIANGAGGDVRLARATIEAIERLIGNLHNRDEYIVDKDLWFDFVAWLSRKDDEKRTDGEIGDRK